jgi:hypothetical protein
MMALGYEPDPWQLEHGKHKKGGEVKAAPTTE